MKNCVYFAENQKIPDEGVNLVPGYGFTPDGHWRDRFLPGEESGLILDDRSLPNQSGIALAYRALEAWRGLLVLDFERPVSVLLSELVNALSGKRLILPPAYAGHPHEAVLIGPWQGDSSFAQWIINRKKRFGMVVLDAAPLCVQCFPGGQRRPWNKALPDVGYPCSALGCLHRRLPDGSILFWDSRQTLSARLDAADVPRIQFRVDWETLPDGSTAGE